MPYFDYELQIEVPDSYRANRVRSMFNVTPEQASKHSVAIHIPLEERDWRVGLVVGPSGSGKTTLGRRLLEETEVFDGFSWPDDAPIIDAIDPDGDFKDITGALSSVGLGTVPSWLRPHGVLSGGERFRADLARLLLEEEGDVIIDEFTSVVDRQVAQIGAGAFAKAWRRKERGRVVCLSCHYDVLDWLQPDWVVDTADWTFQWRSVQRPPPIQVDIFRTNWRPWPLFEPHHYLKLPRMVAAFNYVGLVGETPVAHVAVGTTSGLKSARACRLVVMPEWQGAGVGMRFLEAVCEMWLQGRNPYGRPLTTIIHTSHPGLVAALERRPLWRCISIQMGGASGKKSLQSLRAAALKRAVAQGQSRINGGGNYGGHFRAVAGFRYVGDRPQED